MMGILTPYPGTALYRQLEREGRIFDRNWDNYDCHHVVYEPKNMSADQLIEGYIGLYREVRRHRSVTRELMEGLWRQGPGIETGVRVASNLYQKFDSLKKARHLRENQREIAAGAAGPAGATRLRVA